MSFLDRILLRNDSTTYTSQTLSDLFGTSSSTISKDYAMSLAAFYGGIDIVSNSIASLDRSVYQLTKGYFLKNDGHPVNSLINKKPSTYVNSFDWYKMIVQDLYLSGNAFIQVQRNKQYYPTQLDYINSSYIQVLYNAERTIKKYRNQITGEEIAYDNMIHLMLYTDDGIIGKSVLDYAATSLNLSKSSQDYATNFFEKGSNISGILTTQQKLNAEGRQKIVTAWNSTYQGTSNSFKVAVLEGDLKFTPLSVHPVDSQLLETRKFSTEEIARWLNIPLYMLDGSTAPSNIEVANSQFLQRTILPLDERILAEFNNKIFRPADRSKFQIKTDYTSLLKADIKSRTYYYTSMFNVGVLSDNEIRTKEGMQPLGPEGDIHYVQGNNLVPIDKISAMYDQKINDQQNGN